MCIGMQEGIETALEMIPVFLRQQIQVLAQQKLDLTRDEYLNALEVMVEGDMIIVGLDEDNWLANAQEDGVGAFDMKIGHLKSPKTKISKEGFKYLIIPMKKMKGYQPNPNTKSFLIQKKIDEALKKPSYGAMRSKTMNDGQVHSMEELITNDPDLKGMYRSRRFKIEDGKQVQIASQFVMFRVMSEKQTNKWWHPGIQGKHILEQTQSWADYNLPKLIDDIVNKNIESALELPDDYIDNLL